MVAVPIADWSPLDHFPKRPELCGRKLSGGQLRYRQSFYFRRSCWLSWYQAAVAVLRLRLSGTTQRFFLDSHIRYLTTARARPLASSGTLTGLVCDQNSMTTANYPHFGKGPATPGRVHGPSGYRRNARAATTLLAAGLLVSTFDFVPFFLVEVAVFLPTRDFFSIAILVSPGSI